MTELRADLFGMPLVMHDEDVAYAEGLLHRAWVLQAGRRARAFESDLAVLESWFHPRLRGMTLRQRLGDLPPLDVGATLLPEQVLLPCGEERYLVTPEGRAWLECLPGARRDDDARAVFSPDQADPLERVLLRIYTAWSRHRLADVIEKRTGAGAPLLPPAAGLILLMLVNRTFGPGNAIQRVRDDDAQQKIDDVIADVLEPFSDALGGQSARGRSRSHFSLWGGYALSEARRRLASRLVLDQDRGLVYLAEGSEREVVDFVTRDIARRPAATPERVAEAFRVLVEAYRGSLEQLTRLGSGFERAGRTDALQERLVDAARAARDTPAAL